MAELGFYDLAGHPLVPSLAGLLEPVVAAGERAVVLVSSPERLEMVNAGLWTYTAASFLPHGSAGDGFPERQPVWLTTVEENPNGAAVLVSIDDAGPAALDGFGRYIFLFDRNDPDLRALARERWRTYRDAGAGPVYWECSAEGWRRT